MSLPPPGPCLAGSLALAGPTFPAMETSLRTLARINLGQTPAKLLRGGLDFRPPHWHGAGAGGGAWDGAAAGPPAGSPLGVGPGAAAAAAAGGGELPLAAVVVTAAGGVLALRPLPPAPPQHAQQAAPLQRALGRHPAAAPLSGASHAQYRGGRLGPFTGRPVGPLFRHPAPVGAGGMEASPPASPMLGLQQAQQAQHAQQAQQQQAEAEQDQGQRMSLDEALPPRPDAVAGEGEGEVAAAAAAAAGASAGPEPAAAAEGAAQEEGGGLGWAILDGDLLEELQGLPDGVQLELLGGQGV